MARSKVLVSRLTRLVETNGRIGEGMMLVSEYSDAVTKINDRLDAVIAAIQAKQVSDAVRIMQDQPPLLDEVSILDFNQVDALAELVKKRGWGQLVRIDKTALEQVLYLNSDAAVAEPLLKMYRKAVRLKDMSLAVQTLRQLVKVDHSQDWKANLTQAEASLRKEMYAAFSKARTGEDRETMLRIANEYVSPEWLDAPVGKAADEILLFLNDEDRAEKKRKIDENLTIIRNCGEGEWDRELVQRMVDEINMLAESGGELSDSDRGAVEMAGERCAAERAAEEREEAERREAEEKERHWQELREALFVAVEREDVEAIRVARAVPEFDDREPEEELLRKADMILRRAEELRVRKLRMCVISGVVIVAGILGISWKVLQDKKYNEKCAKEAEKLAAFEKGPNAIERLTSALKQIKENDPEVYGSPEVSAYEGKLSTLIEQTARRTNEIVSIIGELDEMKAAQWADAGDGVTGRVARVESLMTIDDEKYRQRLVEIKLSWHEFTAAQLEAKKKKAAQFHEPLVAHVREVARKLETIYAKPSVLADADSCVKAIAEWRRDYGEVRVDLAEDISRAEAELAASRKRQADYVAAIGKVNAATNALDTLESRQNLLAFYSSYSEVERLTTAPVSGAEALSVTDGGCAALAAFAHAAGIGGAEAADDRFKSFVEDGIKPIKDFPALYSLYGIKGFGEKRHYYFAVSGGLPKFEYSTSSKSWSVAGSLITCAHGNYEETPFYSVPGDVKPQYELLPVSEEIRKIVELANLDNVTRQDFSFLLLSLIRAHLKAASEDRFVEMEIAKAAGGGSASHLQEVVMGANWLPAIRRLQLIKFYLDWLCEDVGTLQPDARINQWRDKITRICQPIPVDGIPNDMADMTWVCLKYGPVAKRNEECARMLVEMAKTWEDDLEAAKLSASAKRVVAKWQVSFAGRLLFMPWDPAYERNVDAIMPETLPDVKKDHPLYILRKDAEKLVLKKAFVVQNEKWAVMSDAKDLCIPGEPLFQISDGKKMIDTKDAFRALTAKLPERTAERLAESIPLFDVGRK